MGKAYIRICLFWATCLFPALVLAESPEALNRHGVQLGEKKMYDEAILKFDEAIRHYDTASAKAYHNKAWALELKGQLGSAVKFYEEAIRRNPYQVVSGEKLGFIYYRLKDYENAVRVGEHVLKIDPKNKEVPKWLPDAYIKKLELQRQRALAKKKKEDEEKNKLQQRKMKEKDQKEREATVLYATFDFMLRTGYYFAGSNDGSFQYIADDAFLVNVVNKMFVRFTPDVKWQLEMTLENPFLGALTPSGLVVHTEKLEGAYRLDNFMIGLGLMFNHYESDISFGEELRLWDFKTGFIFGNIKDNMEIKITFYPRLLPHDGESSSNQTFDVDSFRMDYLYKVSSTLRYYSVLSWDNYYLFDHSAGISSYWGVYQIGLGVTLGYISKTTNRKDISVSIEFIERLYMRDLNNDDPYGRLNGQGWFGMNSSEWLTGSPFSGFRAFGHALGVKVEEQITANFFLYQKLIFEMGDLSENHHEFNLLLGIGAMF